MDAIRKQKFVRAKNCRRCSGRVSLVWTRDVSQRTDWIYALTHTDIAEIETAMRPLVEREADIAQIRKADFPLPTLGPKITKICNEVMNGRGFALMRGLPVRKLVDTPIGDGLFRHRACTSGNARSQNGKGHMLGHVTDLGRDAVNDPTARIYQTAERQTFHTDSCDIVALLCLKTAKMRWRVSVGQRR